MTPHEARMTRNNEHEEFEMSEPLRRVPTEGVEDRELALNLGLLHVALNAAINRINEQAVDIGRLQIRIDDLLRRHEGHEHHIGVRGNEYQRTTPPKEQS